jgi:hypothetical protein
MLNAEKNPTLSSLGRLEVEVPKNGLLWLYISLTKTRSRNLGNFSIIRSYGHNYVQLYHF